MSAPEATELARALARDARLSPAETLARVRVLRPVPALALLLAGDRDDRLSPGEADVWVRGLRAAGRLPAATVGRARALLEREGPGDVSKRPSMVGLEKCADDWPAYFGEHAARWRAHLDGIEGAAEAGAPAPEHTVRQPWPEGLAVPGGAAKLIKAADAAGWGVRFGYARAWRKGIGRGVFTRTHYVRVQARRAGQSVRATWRRACTDGQELPGAAGWSFDAGAVNGWPASVTAITAALRVTGDP